jgi:DNA-binding response OmpR family regulator
MTSQLKVLLIEDSPEDVKFASIQLKQSFGDDHLLTITDYYSKASKLVDENKFDIIILDLSLPDSNGLTSLRNLVNSCTTPVIIYTGLADEAVKANALQSGAYAYLIKGETPARMLKESIITTLEKMAW